MPEKSAQKMWNRYLQFTRPGKRLHNELEHHHAIYGKIHYFDWAMFNSKL